MNPELLSLILSRPDAPGFRVGFQTCIDLNPEASICAYYRTSHAKQELDSTSAGLVLKMAVAFSAIETVETVMALTKTEPNHIGPTQISFLTIAVEYESYSMAMLLLR